ncbi:MAG: 4-(cytidine 5'-diphospho)-2-C-methyl-D-erythritol kinase [Bacilli bacterium]|nr:4-(cytidine 5'-diphospho)-2-C-methyl-D-erythritol kinase [Bacilli bacterium]
MINNSYAKINLAINLIKKDENNYHQLDMLTSKVKLYDKIEIKLAKHKNIKLTCSNRFIPCNSKNLVYRAANLVLTKYNIETGLDIKITKYIPIQAGLGGGSANAATTIEMLNKIFKLNMTLEDKISLGEQLGSDIPLFFHNGVCRVQGYGEKVSIVNNLLKDMVIVLVKPNRGLSTKQVYQNVNLNTCNHPNVDLVVKALENNDYPLFIDNIANSLEESATSLKPLINEMIDELYHLGIDKCIVCGSGSTIVGFTKNKDVALKIKETYYNKNNFVFITKMI